MLIAEYDYDVDIAVQREEALQEGEAKGFSIGIAQGEAKGFSEGLSEGSYQKALETAKTMLAMHYPLEDICKITGLTEAEIEQL